VSRSRSILPAKRSSSACRPRSRSTVNLTVPDVSDRDPTWNAVGTKIAFHRGDADGTIRGIWTMNADGTGLAMVPNTDDGRTVAWSPDGSQLAFVCDDPVGGDTEICTIGSDGSGRTQLTATAGFEDGPAWSPDGSEIAFSRTTADEDRARLVAISPVTQQERFITTNVVGQWDSSPDWSPDGSRLAFERFVSGSGRGGAIHTIAADGSDLHLLTAPAPGLDIHHVTPAWSPKGKRIAFAVVDDDLAFGHIFTIRPNGHALRQITFGAVTDFDPSWRPVSGRGHADDAPGRSHGASPRGHQSRSWTWVRERAA